MPSVRPRTSWAPLADLGDGQLHDAAGVGERRVEGGDAHLGRAGQVDLVGADAEGPDRDQVGSGVQHGGGHRRLGADAQQLHAIEGRDQLRLVECALDLLDVDAAFGEQPDTLGVDVLQQ